MIYGGALNRKNEERRGKVRIVNSVYILERVQKEGLGHDKKYHHGPTQEHDKHILGNVDTVCPVH